MKKLVILLLVIFAGIAGIYLFNVLNRKNSSYIEIPAPMQENATISESENNEDESPLVVGEDYTVASIVVRDSKKIELHENFDEKLSASDAKQKYACEHILSGGFYGEDNKHLGLLINDGKLVSETIDSDLFNGFYSINNKGRSAISYTEPVLANSKMAFQAGPVLLENSKPLELSIKNDEKARRIVAALNPQNHTIFLAIYQKNSLLSGPKLSELPEILDKLQKNTNLKFINALNLDGGTHSAFISGNVALNELVRSGTFICIKP